MCNKRGVLKIIKKLDLKNIETAKDVLELQISSYKVEAKIINFYGIPTLKDTVDSLKTCDEIFYGYYINGDLAGIISYNIIANLLDICRVAVHPRNFRMGIAGELINFVEELEGNANKVVVCTGKENLPAVNLYIKKGYQKTRDIEISKGNYLMEFEKIL